MLYLVGVVGKKVSQHIGQVARKVLIWHLKIVKEDCNWKW